MNIFVGNINYRLTEDELRAAFENYGEVSSVKIVKDRETGRAKGFGFVEMPDDDEANAAINSLNSANVGGRDIIVNVAKPREEGSERRSSSSARPSYQRNRR
jgi:RNA recognition motif-containing protein